MLFHQRIELHAGSLTASERALSEVLQGSYPQGLLDSASAMALEASTSAATVVRFFAKLGYPSMADVRREARSQLAGTMANPSQRSTYTLKSERSLAECVDDALLHDQHNLQATYQGLDLEAFAAMAKLLADEGKKLYVMAGENSEPVAAYLATHLHICRPEVLRLGNQAPFAVDRMLWVGPNDVLLAYSIRRYALATLQAAQHFHAQGAQVLLLTDNLGAPIAQYAHHSLLVETANASPFDSYTASFFVCNALISAVTQMRKIQVEDTLRQRDMLWSQWGGGVPISSKTSTRAERTSKAKARTSQQ